jgi:ribosomal protein S18 acetylase RimI-like enzyme
MSREVRVASPEDAPDIVDLIRIGVEERAFHNRVVSDEGYFGYAFDNPPRGYNLFICLIDDEITGYVDGSVGKWGVGYVSGICVKPEHRRKGVGELLMDKILDQFRLSGCHKVRIEVFADNQGAVKFYSRCNFVKEGYLENDEEKRDVIIMSKFLKPQEDSDS